MREIETAIKELARELRARLQEVEEIPSLDFTIEISGRVHDGELSIKYEIGSTYKLGGAVKGGSVEAIFKECLRRFGWDQRNKPLELSFAPETPHPDQPVGSRSEEEPF